MDRETSLKRSKTIKKLLDAGYTVSDLSSIFGLSTQTIWRIKYSMDKSEETALDKIEIKEYNGK